MKTKVQSMLSHRLIFALIASAFPVLADAADGFTHLGSSGDPEALVQANPSRMTDIEGEYCVKCHLAQARSTEQVANLVQAAHYYKPASELLVVPRTTEAMIANKLPPELVAIGDVMTFHNGFTTSGNGTLITQCHVLTSAHLVFDKGEVPSQHVSVRFATYIRVSVHGSSTSM
jgi:hypothetical protein